MVVEAVQNYVNLVNGLRRVTRDRALSAARALLAQAGLEGVANDAGERVGKLAEEIMLANRANRELVENLIAAEVDKAAGRWGFVRTDDVEALREEIAELRKALIRATTSTATGEGVTRTARKAAGRPKASKTPASQGPPLGGAPEPGGVDPSHPELVPSEPLPYQPGPIQPTAKPPAAKKRSAAKRPAQKSPTKAPTKAAAKSPSKAAAKSPTKSPTNTSTKAATEALVAPTVTAPTPVADGDVARVRWT